MLEDGAHKGPNLAPDVEAIQKIRMPKVQGGADPDPGINKKRETVRKVVT